VQWASHVKGVMELLLHVPPKPTPAALTLLPRPKDHDSSSPILATHTHQTTKQERKMEGERLMDLLWVCSNTTLTKHRLSPQWVTNCVEGGWGHWWSFPSSLCCDAWAHLLYDLGFYIQQSRILPLAVSCLPPQPQTSPTSNFQFPPTTLLTCSCSCVLRVPVVEGSCPLLAFSTHVLLFFLGFLSSCLPKNSLKTIKWKRSAEKICIYIN
jgi:hypothetical protein